ncbi:MAG: helix-turn-helix domain-containing protein [Candidatus Diapherotrites archaeon]|nr:helix-turn-helix domain-containing protein [Candidatus Diapherotrites archaeon]
MEKACPVAGIINILGKKWALWILKKLSENGKMRFNDLLNEIDRINSSVLSKRLKELEKAGLLKRKKFNEIPPRIEYSLTKAGKELIKCFKFLGDWAKKHGNN